MVRNDIGRAVGSAWIALLVYFAATVTPAPASNLVLSGAGATFPYPFYLHLFDAYSKTNGVKIRYDAVGSGSGIKAITAKKVDFAGTDAYMNAEEMKKAGGNLVHIPTCMGAVALTYNLPGHQALRFSPDVIADIFLGKIRSWRDPRIAALNPEATLPALAITVVHRSDASGTTFIFSEYLSKISREWREKMGTGKTVSWSTGEGAKGNPGVAGLINRVQGAVGYVELIYALGNGMQTASVRNRSGNFIAPNPASVSLAGNVRIPEDTHISLTDTAAPRGYPISGFTWLVLYPEQDYDQRSRARAEALVNLLWWVTHGGQAYAQPLHYAPLSREAQTRAETLLMSVTYKGNPLLNP
jgi:phosphate transport system substrate-binding protein